MGLSQTCPRTTHRRRIEALKRNDLHVLRTERRGTKGAVEKPRFSIKHPMLPLDDPEVYRAALENVTAGVYLVDPPRKIMFLDAGAGRISGYLRPELLWALFH